MDDEGPNTHAEDNTGQNYVRVLDTWSPKTSLWKSPRLAQPGFLASNDSRHALAQLQEDWTMIKQIILTRVLHQPAS